MVEPINILQLLTKAQETPLFDVRTPAEFEQGHIPHAINLPLFSNEERAIVGTIYKQENPQQALLKGLEFVGPKMRFIIEKVAQITPNKKVAIHCWRGGKRSGSVGWLLGMAGYQTQTVIGGYKAYRNHVLKEFQNRDLNLLILGGKTGSGKTKILKALAAKGEQIIDLEGLAHHKGSAFGYIGESSFPTVEQFENNIFAALSELDFSKRIWVENESRRIGKVTIPEGFWRQMKAAPLIHLELPFEVRLKVSLEHYSTNDKAALELAFNNIKKRLGGLNWQKALQFLEDGNLKAAAAIALKYYDKLYQYMLDNNEAAIIKHLFFDKDEPIKTADFLIDFVEKELVLSLNKIENY